MDIRKLIQDRGVEGALIAIGEYLDTKFKETGDDIDVNGVVIPTKEPRPTSEPPLAIASPLPTPTVEESKGVTLG